MVDKKYQDELPRIKKMVEEEREYFKPNIDRFNVMKRFTFETTQSDDEKSTLALLGKPSIEFNICESHLSRLWGEFLQQQPDIEVSAEDGAPVHPEQVKLVEGIMRHQIDQANKNGTEFQILRDTMGGGFSAYKVWTEYENEMTFKQVIRFGKVFNPCLTGFDPLARNPSKSDGRFAFELYPKTLEEFKNDFPDINTSEIKFYGENTGFRWSYRTQKKEKVILICDFYEKKKTKVKIVQLPGGFTMKLDEYNERLAAWKKREEEGAEKRQAPQIVGKPRETEIVSICRYRFIENMVLEYTETDFKSLPLVFVDGNSEYIETSGRTYQITRPYLHNAVGIQKLINFAGQTLANEFENMVMHKWKISKQSIPTEKSYQDAFTNNQIPNVIVYNELYNNDPNIRLTAPQEVVRTPIPPEISNVFFNSQQILQQVLGSYDASLGAINNNQTSGKAIVEGAFNSNATSMPYIGNKMQGLSQVAQVMLEVIPKYYIEPRTMATIGMDGKKVPRQVNYKGGVNLQYPDNSLKVKVEAGVNFTVQKNKALQAINAQSQSTPAFGQFIAQDCLDIIVDNIDCRGADLMKQRAEPFMKNMKEQQAQAAQAAQQNNPMMMKQQQLQQELQLKNQQMQSDAQIENRKQDIAQQQTDNERMDILLKAQQAHEDRLVQLEKSNTERMRAATELALSHVDGEHQRALNAIQESRAHADQLHQHTKDALEFAHTVTQAQQQPMQQPTGDMQNG